MSEQDKHTPGPWDWEDCDDNEFEIYELETGEILAIINHECDGNHEANARLMAAAPELVEALEDATRLSNSLLDTYLNGGVTDVQYAKDRIDAAQRALAKVKGQTADNQELPPSERVPQTHEWDWN